MLAPFPRAHRALAASVLLFGLLAAARATAQPPAVVWESSPSVGLDRVDGVLEATGPSFRARFTSGAVEFTPARGAAAPRPMPLRLALVEVGRGDDLRPVEAVAPTHSGLRVTYARPGVVERYDVRHEGIEQSFSFDALPPGRGDLVVRYRIDTELEPAAAEDGVAFATEGGLGGVHIGAVTGIDAGGARVRGSIAHRGTGVELRVPASFVDRARLPLVVDPLIGTTVAVASGLTVQPDVAYDPGTDTYFVVWKGGNSGDDVVGQRLDATGQPIGAPIVVSVPRSFFLFAPRVTSVPGGWFVVTWGEVVQWSAATVRADTGAIGSRRRFPGNGLVGPPALGGGSAAGAAFVVWPDRDFSTSTDGIEAIRLDVDAAGAIAASAPVTLASIPSSMGTATAPNIAHSGGIGPARFLVTWREQGLRFSRLMGAVIDPSLNVLDNGLTITTASGGGHASDGDGTHWTVAYDHAVFGGEQDLRCRRVTYDARAGAVYLGPEVTLRAVPSRPEHVGDVLALPRSTLVATREQSLVLGTNFDSWLRSVDPFSCAPCEAPSLIQSGTFRDVESVSLARREGVGAGEDALVVWQSVDPLAGTSTIRARPFRARDGSLRLTQPGCGAGGTAFGTCALRGNTGFALRLRHAAPSAPAVAVVSAAALPAGAALCPGCSLFPDLTAGVIVPVGSTSSHGDAAVGLPIPDSPAVVGVTLWSQWAVLSGAAPCGVLDLSNAIGTAIE